MAEEHPVVRLTEPPINAADLYGGNRYNTGPLLSYQVQNDEDAGVSSPTSSGFSPIIDSLGGVGWGWRRVFH